MESLLLKIRGLYPTMGRNERKVANWILVYPQDIISMSITAFAAICGCSDATVFRFSKRLGLNGYQALKIGIAQEVASRAPDSANIEKTDGCITIYQKRTRDIAQALEMMGSALSPKELENAANEILSGRRIAILGRYSSTSVTMDAQYKFMCAELNATPIVTTIYRPSPRLVYGRATSP